MLSSTARNAFLARVVSGRWITVSAVKLDKGSAGDQKQALNQSARVINSFEGRKVEFSKQNARGHQDYSESAQATSKRSSQDLSKVQGGMVDEECYQPTSNVSLHSVMQSSVPHPCSNSPNHINMPGGGLRKEDKFLSGVRQDTYTHRKYSGVSASLRHFATVPEKELIDVQGVQGEVEEKGPMRDKIREKISPQGIQGENDDTHRIFLENCERLEIGGCEAILDDVKAGRMTMDDAFKEQARRVQAKEDEEKVGKVAGPLNRRQQLKQAVRDYGATVVVFHIGISLMSLGGFYVAVSSGIDVQGMLAYIGLLGSGKLATNASTFVAAYAVHKVFAPVRIAITLSASPFIVTYLRRIGFLKPPKIKKLR